MIGVSEQAAQVIRSGVFQKPVFFADVTVDGERVLQGSPLSSVSMTWNGDSHIRGTGRGVFSYSDDLGASIVPSTLTSWFTPYATFLLISMRIQAGDFTEDVLLGEFKLIKVTDPVDFRKPFQGRYISIGSSVGLQLADRFRTTDKERFPVPFGPSDLSSVWGEIGRLTRLPLSRNVDDAPISRAVTYQENRLDAVFDLASILDGTPFIDENGRVTLETNTWPEASEEISSDVLVSRIPADLSDDEIYNQVVVRSYDAEQSSILATAEIVEGRLRFDGPFGRIPYFVSSQFVTTVQQAQEYASRTLPTVSTEPALQFILSIVPDPRRQVGDVVPFEWDGVVWHGRIREVTLTDSGSMSLRVVAVIVGMSVSVGELWFPDLDIYPELSLYPEGDS